MGCRILSDDGERLLRWLESAIGQELVLRERQCVEDLCSDLFGCYMLQLGWSRTFSTPTAKSRIQKRIILEECFSLMGGTGKILGKQDVIPILSDSMDVVFMPHTLEFTDNPQQVLCEVERVLISGGHLIILGFNLWSLWGVCSLFLHHSRALPWCGKFLSLNWLTKWLTIHGFHIEHKRSILFLPPLRQAYLLHRFHYLEPILEYCLPFSGAVYVIRAVKRNMAIISPEPMAECIAEPFIVPAFSSTACEDGNFPTSAS